MTEKPPVVILHGFAGGPHETDVLQRYLEERNYPVISPVLAGHGGTRRDLLRHGPEEWIASAKRQAEALCAAYGPPVLIGFSMGGLIAANLFSEVGARALVTVNTPIYFWNIPQIARNIQSDLQTGQRGHIEHYRSSVGKVPVRYALRFLMLLKKTKPIFWELSCDALVLQCMDDDTTWPKSAEYIKNCIGKRAALVHYEQGGHLLFAGKAAEGACRQIEMFLTKISG
ncbi:alpha/beta fold hydrolase [Oscillospiraceae bacterium OttesenSCG-928-G22]|nr:alpha/beta fold hydrolase [Oscillospiraceae bacterium OttesenSCG-928-G22]